MCAPPVDLETGEVIHDVVFSGVRVLLSVEDGRAAARPRLPRPGQRGRQAQRRQGE